MAQPKLETIAPEKRIRSFQEVSLGYPKRIAQDEARRCPQCANPVCVPACPLGINIPRFIRNLREGDLASAYQVVREESALPSVCGRICSAPCEAACVLNDEHAPIGIRALERYVCDNGRSKPQKVKAGSGKKVAVIGSGPAGLMAAASLSKKGMQVTIFESLDRPGGALRYGIPEFRVPKKILDQEIDDIKASGVEIITNAYVGRTISLAELKKQGYTAILLALGAGIPQFMELKGSNLGGVYYGEEFLMRINLAKQGQDFMLGERVAVIGSGNTALDCARTARRYVNDVKLIFRRTEDEMRVRADERVFAKEEGVVFEPLVRPIEIMAGENEFVSGLKCVRMDYADSNADNKWELVPVPDSEFIMDVDTLVMAIGHRPNSTIHRFEEKLAVNRDGTLKVDARFMTSIDGVFACGNVVTHAGPIVEAMASGKKAAAAVVDYIVK